MLNTLIKSAEPSTRKSRSPAIGVLSAKGGVGGSTTAINLALAMSSIYGGATLVDANLQQPDVAAFLDLNSPYTVLDLVNRPSMPDGDVLFTCTTALAETTPSCRLLAPPRNGEAYLQTNLTAITGCLKHLKNDSASWVLDLPKHLDKHLVTTFDFCDLILLVFEPTLVAVNAAHRWLAVFEQLGYERSKYALVLNRAGGRLKGVEEQLGKVFAGLPLLRVPNAYELIERLSAVGEPVLSRYPREPYAAAINALAQAAALAVSSDRGEKR